ncbi:MAG: carbamoyltransferase HypF [Acidimicrobiales bacterium]
MTIANGARHRIRVEGIVQGVGFRPFVLRLATSLDLSGHVLNDSGGLYVEVEGGLETLRRFEALLVADAPPLASIQSIDVTEIAALGDESFTIQVSHTDEQARTFVSPDVAVCDDCLGEMKDPADRRYRYPFINCTNCGPRFSITIRLPYDRPNTTMAGFPMCEACRLEYHDVSDRRFHAQPIACADCGPHIWFQRKGSGGRIEGDTAIGLAHKALASGEIVAVKGLGGFHLACDATSDSAVIELRRRKRRGEKPFAVMARDLSVVDLLTRTTEAQRELLRGWQRPIVILDKLPIGPLSHAIAPGNPHLGVLLPYTPLHHLLLSRVPGSDAPVPFLLVMTSGNLSDEPIAYDDADALRRLGGIADCWLTHDRPIHVPCDDSVIGTRADEFVPIRRSRGFAPIPIKLPFEAPPVLAVGGETKNTFCMAAGEDAWMSQHIGDMGSVETLDAFAKSNKQFEEIYRVRAEALVADSHPGYHTRRWAEEQKTNCLILVQHHHAHIASLMAENGIASDGRVIGFAFDGTGFGSDGAIWGGEALIARYDGFERAAHLRYVPLAGGDATIRKPYRAALSHLKAAGVHWAPELFPVQAASGSEIKLLNRQLETGFRCVPTSSMGRLFDAVSSILGVRQVASYEAQAAIEMEAIASAGLQSPRKYQFVISGDEIDQSDVIRGIVSDLRLGIPIAVIAAGFHVAVADMVSEVADTTRTQHGIGTVGLSGGVFQNLVLVGLIRQTLERKGFEVLTHRVVPSNDGGLALGQVAVAAAARAAARSGVGRS